MNPKHILLTSDLSEEASRAHAPARELAKALEAKITLLHVIPVLTKTPVGAVMDVPVTHSDPEAERRSAAKALEKEASLLGTDVEVVPHLTTSTNIAGQIAEFADKNGVDLIAMSTHGRSGLRRLALGSVAESVLRHSHVPVLCFPPKE